MKPRLRRAPLTHEDWDIWTQRFNPGSLHNPLYDIAVTQDRRDADLMLVLRKSRELCRNHGFRSCIVAGYECIVENYDDIGVKSLMEMGLAMMLPKL